MGNIGRICVWVSCAKQRWSLPAFLFDFVKVANAYLVFLRARFEGVFGLISAMESVCKE